MKKRDYQAAINRPIKRRDFIAGVGVALSGSLLSCSWAENEFPTNAVLSNIKSSSSNTPYPPVRTGLRGSHPGSFEVAHQMRDGKKWDTAEIEDTGENYDLVVVGGGISGLSAAWFYKEARPDARILILDNHDDFGGHAKRNEFWYGDRMLLSHGGTINIEDFNEYDEAAQRMIRSLGIEPERYSEFHDQKLYTELDMGRGQFFDKKIFGSDRLVANVGKPSWSEYLAKTPLAKSAQEDIRRLHESKVDYMAGLSLEEKRKRLMKMSYQDFLVDIARIKPESLDILREDGYWAIGIDALPAWTAVASGKPGTQHLGFAEEPYENTYFRFPDGNASIARLLVRSMVPAVADGKGMEDIVSADFDYNKLDLSDSQVRVRLESTVVAVSHLGDPQNARQVSITYVKNGKAKSIKAGRTVLACYNSVIPHICKELPAKQTKALSQSLKAPLVYTNVMLNNWRAFAKLGVHNIRCPGSYFKFIRLSRAMNIGDYQHAKSPDEPVILELYRTPLSPGLSAQEQWKAGRKELLSTTFETFERELRDQLDRMFSAGGFDSSRDIEAITINRWPHGYAYGQNPENGDIAYLLDEVPEEIAPWRIGRQRFGRIAIANSDASANAMTEGAIGQAYRAIADLIL